MGIYLTLHGSDFCRLLDILNHKVDDSWSVMATQMSLANHFLIAMPSCHDMIFGQSVIYICEHHVHGTIGFIVNRSTSYSFDLVFEQLKIKSPYPEISRRPLMFGGPLQSERGFVIHRPFGQWRSSLVLVSDQVAVTTSNDVIQAIAENQGPPDMLLALGYVGWDSHQLEQEIIHDMWLVCPFKAELLYDVPFSERWKAAAMTMGIHIEQLTSGGGHA